MSSTFTIKHTLSVIGDWYCVSNPEADRWFIDRVVVWAVVSSATEVDHVRAITVNGLPHEDNGGNSYLVNGYDVSPMGTTWDNVYKNAPLQSNLVREITDSVRGHM